MWACGGDGGAEVAFAVRGAHGGAAVTAAAWSPDALRLFSAGKDCAVRCWDALSGAPLGALQLSTTLRGLTALAARPTPPDCDGVFLVAGAENGSVQRTYWRGETAPALAGSTAAGGGAARGECCFSLAQPILRHSRTVASVAFSRDGALFATSSFDKSVALWDAEAAPPAPDAAAATAAAAPPLPAAVPPSLADQCHSVDACSIDPATRVVLSAAGNGIVSVWDGDGTLLKKFSTTDSALLGPGAEPSRAVALCPANDAAASNSGGSLRSFAIGDASGTVAVATMNLAVGAGGAAAAPRRVLAMKGRHDMKVWALRWRPDGRRLATVSRDKTAKIWDAASGECLNTLEGHSHFVRAVAWSPDGRRLVTGGDDTKLLVWDPESGSHLLELSGHAYVVTAADWSGDGRLIASASYDETARVWDAQTGAQLAVLSGHAGRLSGVLWLGLELPPAAVGEQEDRADPPKKQGGSGAAADRLLLTSSEDGSLRAWRSGASGGGEHHPSALSSTWQCSHFAFLDSAIMSVSAANPAPAACGALACWDIAAGLKTGRVVCLDFEPS